MRIFSSNSSVRGAGDFSRAREKHYDAHCDDSNCYGDGNVFDDVHDS